MSTYFSLPIKSKSASLNGKGGVFGKGNANLNPYEKHKQLIQRYQALKPSAITTVSDLDVLRKSHKFLRDVEDEKDLGWEDRLAKKYYDKLFKEYCLGDFSRYKTGVVGLRWRTKQECADGKGHFSCGNLKCANVKDLSSWEVNFAYLEEGEKKNALVKIRLCPDCSYKLNYRKIKADKKLNKKRKTAEENDGEQGGFKKSRGEERDDIVEPQDLVGKSDDAPIVSDDSAKEEDEYEKPTNIWAVPIKLEESETKTKEQEMDEYLMDLFA